MSYEAATRSNDLMALPEDPVYVEAGQGIKIFSPQESFLYYGWR
jgi:hypothetical protein